MRLLISISALVSILASGCREPASGPCPGANATFLITLSTDDRRPLPDGTAINLTYGGSSMLAYQVGQGSTDTELLCCAPKGQTLGNGSPACLRPPGVRDTGSVARDAGPLYALVCEVWTHGAADAFVEASGYLPLQETLKARLSDDPGLQRCSTLETVDIHLTLSRPDAGLIE